MVAIKFVLFDLGGVLVNWHMSWITSEVSQKFGIEEDKLKPAFSKYLPLLDSGHIKEEEFWQSIGNDTKTNQLTCVSTSLWYDIFKKKAHPNFEVFGLINQLKENRIRLAALSNIEEKTYSVLKEWGLMTAFEFQFLSYKIGYSKPDYRIYKHVIDSLDCKADEIFFIDDRIENVEAAKKAGMTSVRYQSSSLLKELLSEMKLL